VDASNLIFSSLDGVLFDKMQTTLIRCPLGEAGNYTIPSGVTCLGEGAFWECSRLVSVTIPSSVTNIGPMAFANCSCLTGVYFKGNAPSLGDAGLVTASKATVYYRPNTTGWGKTFGGRPTAVWNPQAMINASSGVQAK